MIEFTPDGPFAEKADQLFPGRVRVLGLGQTGASVCDQLVLHGRPQQDLWVFDSDQLTIEASVVPNRQLLGRGLVHGLGCSGDVELAREIVAMEESRLTGIAHACDFLVLVVGLSGATGVALAEHFIALGHDAGAKVIVVGVHPFAFEGVARRERAIQAIADLRAEADSVLVLSQDRIAEAPATQKNIRHGFHLMHQHLAHTVQALSQIVCKRGLIQLSFADVRSLYGRYSGSEVLENCWTAHVDGDIHDRTEDLVAGLLTAPMLADETVWKRVDHAIVAVNGSRDLGLSEVQEMVNLFRDRLPTSIPIATSASLDDDSHDSVRMTVLLATTAPARLSVPELTAALEKPRARKRRPKADTAPLKMDTVVPAQLPEPEVATPTTRKAVRKPVPMLPPQPKPQPAAMEPNLTPVEEFAAIEEPEPMFAPLQPDLPPDAAPQRSGRFEARQEEMSFEAPPRGRFEKTHETMYRGENLDQPTYRRRGLKIKV
jgi:cell division protein FtsZ